MTLEEMKTWYIAHNYGSSADLDESLLNKLLRVAIPSMSSSLFTQKMEIVDECGLVMGNVSLDELSEHQRIFDKLMKEKQIRESADNYDC